jgi:hypothetical protein
VAFVDEERALLAALFVVVEVCMPHLLVETLPTPGLALLESVTSLFDCVLACYRQLVADAMRTTASRSRAPVGRSPQPPPPAVYVLDVVAAHLQRMVRAPGLQRGALGLTADFRCRRRSCGCSARVRSGWCLRAPCLSIRQRFCAPAWRYVWSRLGGCSLG